MLYSAVEGDDDILHHKTVFPEHINRQIEESADSCLKVSLGQQGRLKTGEGEFWGILTKLLLKRSPKEPERDRRQADRGVLDEDPAVLDAVDSPRVLLQAKMSPALGVDREVLVDRRCLWVPATCLNLSIT